MAKQIEDVAILELALPMRRGRPAKFASQAERQAAYRARQDQARDGEVISLRDEIAALRAQLDAALARAKPAGDDRKLRDLEDKVRILEADLAMIKFRKSDRLRELLAKRLVMPERDLAAVFLVDYSGKPIEQGYEFDRATKGALEFGRKAALAVGTINEAVQMLERRRQITDDERAVLEAAAKILGDVHSKSTKIKERAKASGERAKREEAAREKAAADAVMAAFPALDDDAAVLLYFLRDRLNYHFAELRKMRPDTATKWVLDYHLVHAARDARTNLERRVEKAIKAGEKADEAAGKLRAEFDEARPEIEAENKSVLDNINTCRVAVRLAEANKGAAK